MKYPTIARDFVAAASTCQEPVKLNMALKLPSGMHPDTPDFSLKYSAIWNFKYQRHPLKTDKLKHKEWCYVIRRNNPKHQCKHDVQHTKKKNDSQYRNSKYSSFILGLNLYDKKSSDNTMT